MELKHLALRVPPTAHQAFNQTRMELKRIIIKTPEDAIAAFNQTRMELKRGYHWKYPDHRRQLLIRPEWN